jgi:hypothetical protein
MVQPGQTISARSFEITPSASARKVINFNLDGSSFPSKLTGSIFFQWLRLNIIHRVV